MRKRNQENPRPQFFDDLIYSNELEKINSKWNGNPMFDWNNFGHCQVISSFHSDFRLTFSSAGVSRSPLLSSSPSPFRDFVCRLANIEHGWTLCGAHEGKTIRCWRMQTRKTISQQYRFVLFSALSSLQWADFRCDAVNHKWLSVSGASNRSKGRET